MKVHHIGYLVKNIEKSITEFKKLGYTGDNVTRDEYRGIDICFMENNGYIVELISPYHDASTVSGLMKKYKNSPYHLCYISDNLSEDIDKLSSDGYTQIDIPTEAPAINGKKVVFMMNINIGLIELVEA
ncbi:MAG: lactoylglutathione lyase [Lachnospiraceae bacterium]|nr:lactoylglutathione lyase [Lachnospiraceae bacterium]